MRATRRDRLDSYLAAIRERRLARWPLYAVFTGTALAIASNATAAEPNSVVSLVTPASAPTIAAGGVVPLYGTVSMIQPGGWVTIYGTNLASGTSVWNGDF